MKTLLCDCVLPLSGGTKFCVEGERFVPALPPFDEVRRLDGACVLPAFPDAHSHLLAYALSLLQPDGSALLSAEEFVAAAEAFAARRGLPLHAPVTIKNARVLPEGAPFEGHPRPLHVQARSGHAGAFNAAARALLGEGCAARMEERAYLAAVQRLPMPEEGDVLRAFCEAQDDYLAHGMTVAQEGILQPAMFPLYEMLLREGAVRLDVAAYTAPDDFATARARFAGAERLRICGMKLFLDGSPQQRTAFLRAPYTGGGNGAPLMTKEEVLAACRAAAEAGAQLLAHCNGDGAAAIFLSALARMEEKKRRAIRPVLVHGQILGYDQLRECRRLGVVPSFFPAHVLYWGEEHLKNLGEKRARRISPAGSALALGIPFTLHQDAPVCPPDPLEAARCAVLRTTSAGNVFREEAIGARDALRALTEHAAAQYGFSRLGRIAAGYYADFVILEGDPLRDIASARVKETYLRGKRCYPAHPSFRTETKASVRNPPAPVTCREIPHIRSG